MNSFDKAFENFQRFKIDIEEYWEVDLSESDTRSKVLDEILISILGWDEKDIHREGYVRPGYYDYEIRTSTFGFVVEAKKQLHKFKLPQRAGRIKIKTFLNENEELVNQIRKYLIERSLTYGVISNGHQFVVGKFINNNGQDWRENQLIIYQDLNKIEADFTQFYELLSKEAVLDNGRIKITHEAISGKTIVKSENLRWKGSELIRNKLSQQLIPIITQLFEEIYETETLDAKQILEKCYIKNRDVKKYYSELGIFFEDNPPSFDNRISPVQNTDNTYNQLSSQISDNTILPAPIVIIGNTGAGKTTFIKYFVEVSLTNELRKKRPIIYNDFRYYTKAQVGDTKRVYKSLTDQLQNEYPSLNLSDFGVLRKVYQTEINQKKKGIWSYIKEDLKLQEKISEFLQESEKDFVNHFIKISHYLVNVCSKRLCIVFDNADQLDEDSQKEIYILAQSVHRNAKAIVLISLREGYFYKWKDRPPFDAYHSVIFHITAPPYREILKRRINYVLENFNFKPIDIGLANKKMSYQKGSISHLFKNLYKSLFQSQNSEIIAFLEELSWPNIREGLENFKTFLLSGHTKTTDYMSFEYALGDNQSIPIWEFVKSVALGSNYYYRHEKSCICNLFYPSPKNRNHFTKIRILHFLNNTSHETKIQFVSVKKIIDLFVQAGYLKDVIEEEIHELISYNLIQLDNYLSDTNEDVKPMEEDNVRITQSGIYYIKNLVNRFHYIDLVLQDTPIFSDSEYQKILNTFPESDQYGKRDLFKRLTTTKSFVNYLKNQELQDHMRNESNKGVKCLDLDVTKSMLESFLSDDFYHLEVVLGRNQSR